MIGSPSPSPHHHAQPGQALVAAEGEPAPAAAAAPHTLIRSHAAPITRAAAGTVRVMTWNIHGGLGTDRRFDLARVVATILRHHPDVVALQEVDSRRTVAPASSAFRVLREAVGGHGVEAKSIIAPDGEYGQVVLSRWPLGAPQIHDITHAEREPRRAIEVEVAAPAGSFKLIATHFGLSLKERRAQACALVAIARRHPRTTVMLGDFNEWFWPASLRGALGRELPARTQHATFPSWYPLLRLDRIFCWPPDAMRGSFVDRAARRASDHLPVLADVAIG
jgi:endonuclease/exonuclease/phosphatase family metal-dependent hydrolase